MPLIIGCFKSRSSLPISESTSTPLRSSQQCSSVLTFRGHQRVLSLRCGDSFCCFESVQRYHSARSLSRCSNANTR